MRSSYLSVLLLSGFLGCPFATGQSLVVGVIAIVQKTTLDGVALSNGSTIYSGDALTTEKGGFVRLQTGKVQLALQQNSSARFLRFAGRLIVELRSGTIIYSATGGFSPFTVYANDVQFVPGSAGLAVGQINSVSNCEISTYVAHGQLNVSFGDGSLTVREREAYSHYAKVGVSYDRSSSADSAKAPSPSSPDPDFLSPHDHMACPADRPRPAGKPPGVEKTVVAGIAAATGIALYLALESPDSPCPPSASCHNSTK